MKTEKIIKVLKRYSKSLQTMAKEAAKDGDAVAAEHYSSDRIAMEEAISKLEEGKE